MSARDSEIKLAELDVVNAAIDITLLRALHESFPTEPKGAHD